MEDEVFTAVDISQFLDVLWPYLIVCISESVTYQIIQSPHQGFKLMLPNTTLVQRSKSGASPAHGAGWVGFMDGAVQQN